MSIRTRNASRSQEWSTPQDLFDELDREFHFTLDVCATPENAKCERFFTQETDAFRQVWAGVCWCNPPYGRGVARWVAKAYDSSVARGATVVMLLPASTDTRWWHDFCTLGEVRFIKGRLRFGGSDVNAPFASALVIFRSQL